MDKNEIKQNISLDQIVELLSFLGSDSYKIDSNGAYKFQTVCHGGDSYKLYYYTDSQKFHCYTGCQENFDIYELVMKVRGINFIQAINLIANKFGFSLDDGRKKGFIGNTSPMEDWDIIDRYDRIYDRINKDKAKKAMDFYNENVLKLFSETYYQGWIDEGISIESMVKYGILFRIGEGEIIIPHRDINGKLLGIRSRTLVESKIQNGFKYMPTTIQGKYYTHDVSKHLYGLDKNKETIKKLRKIMLVEGEKSVMKCDTMYESNNFTVALSGSNLSTYQRDLILQLGVKEVIIGLDKPSLEDWEDEEKKQKYINNILRISYMLSPYVVVNVLWDEESLLDYKDSPVDKGKEILEYMLDKKQEINTKEVEDEI